MKEQIVLTPIESTKDALSIPELRFDLLDIIISPFAGNKILSVCSQELGINFVIKIPTRVGGAKREWQGLNNAFRVGIPVPEPLVLAHDTEDRQVLLLEKIEGENLYRHPNDPVKFHFGGIIRKMHDHCQIDGDEWSQSEKSNFVYYDRYLFSWSDGIIGELRAAGKTQSLLARFSDAMRYYCETTSPVFTHQDLHDGQVFVKGGNILTLIDFEDWKEETRLSEIGIHLFHTVRTDRSTEGFREFVHGYLDRSSHDEHTKSALAFYLLFTSARALNFYHVFRPNSIEAARVNHQKILEYIDQEKLWKEF